jgi:hypothetical protein
MISESGTVVFLAPVKGADRSGGLFLFRNGRIQKVAASGDLIPDASAGKLELLSFNGQAPPVYLTKFRLNNLDIVAFACPVVERPNSDGLFLYLDGKVQTIGLSVNPAPSVENHSFDIHSFESTIQNIALNNVGDLAFQVPLRGDRFSAGVFVASLLAPDIPNGDFEAVGENGLPIYWQSAWNRSGEASQFDSGGLYSFSGNSHLRLHVDTTGGYSFVVSDPIPVSSETTYLFSSRIRFSLESDTDHAFFSIIQLDGAGNETGFDELALGHGDSLWKWQLKRIAIRTKPDTAFVRVRFGLISSGQSYLDVDDVR